MHVVLARSLALYVFVFSGLDALQPRKAGYLVSLQGQLPQFLASSRAQGTVKRYTGAVNKWTEFARKYELQLWPVRPSDFCLYILHLTNLGKGLSVIDAAFYGIKWVHDCVDLKAPTGFSSVQNAFQAAKRKLSKARQPMDPVPPEVLNKLCADKESCNDLFVVRSVAMAILAFAGFLRADELRCLQVRDFLMHDDFVTLVIRQAKTDQFRKGDHVDIVKTGSVSCPIFWLQKYLKLASIDLDDVNQSDKFVFRQISGSKNGKKLVAVNRALSYSALRESILPLVRPYFPPGARIGLHSFRSGGTTSAAKAGVKGRLLQRHGRWKLASSMNMYIEESMDQRLKVSSNLGL